jgi:hypothetical protein
MLFVLTSTGLLYMEGMRALAKELGVDVPTVCADFFSATMKVMLRASNIASIVGKLCLDGNGEVVLLGPEGAVYPFFSTKVLGRTPMPDLMHKSGSPYKQHK